MRADSICCQKLATYSPPPSRVTPLQSGVDCEVFPCKPEELHDPPRCSVAADLVQRVPVQIWVTSDPPIKTPPTLPQWDPVLHRCAPHGKQTFHFVGMPLAPKHVRRGRGSGRVLWRPLSSESGARLGDHLEVRNGQACPWGSERGRKSAGRRGRRHGLERPLGVSARPASTRSPLMGPLRLGKGSSGVRC